MRGAFGSAVAVAIAVAVLLLLGGCGDADEEDANRVLGDTLTIYSSGPRDGVSAPAGDAAFAGERLALERAKRRAGGRRIRLVRLTSTRPGDAFWDPGTVRGNADRARKDPSAIAYLGELDHGGSAVSLPVTNRAELLQVSPGDGLTSLTRRLPGRPSAGPARYYPTEVRTFARLVPNDLTVAEELVALVRRRGTARVAVVHGEGIADRELVAAFVGKLRGVGVEPVSVEPLREGAGAIADAIGRVAVTRPGAVVHMGPAGADTAAALAGLARRLPGVPVVGDASLLDSPSPAGPRPPDVRALRAVLPAAAQPAAGRRLLTALERESGKPTLPEALYGYEAMRLVIAAIDRAGPDRRGVVRAALKPATRQTALGPLALSRGDVTTRRLALMRLKNGRVVLERVLP